MFRRELMASLAGVRVGEPEYVRLFDTRGCHDVVADLVGQGGLGRLAPFWEGPDDDKVAMNAKLADPDGGDTDDYGQFILHLDEDPPTF